MIDSSENNILLLILSIMIARIYVVHILSYTCTEFQKVPLNIESSSFFASAFSVWTGTHVKGARWFWELSDTDKSKKSRNLSWKVAKGCIL